MSIENEILNSIDFDAIIDEFVILRSRKKKILANKGNTKLFVILASAASEIFSHGIFLFFFLLTSRASKISGPTKAPKIAGPGNICLFCLYG